MVQYTNLIPGPTGAIVSATHAINNSLDIHSKLFLLCTFQMPFNLY